MIDSTRPELVAKAFDLIDDFLRTEQHEPFQRYDSLSNRQAIGLKSNNPYSRNMNDSGTKQNSDSGAVYHPLTTTSRPI